MVDEQMPARKVDRGAERSGCPVEQLPDGTWLIRGYDAATILLRSTDTAQAGLGVETVAMLPKRIRRPVLYQDGADHREHRRQTARYFTPRWVDEHYRGVMNRAAVKQIDRFRAAGRIELSDLVFPFTIEVVATVVGLTESRSGLQRRLDRFFPAEQRAAPGLSSVQGIRSTIRQGSSWLRVYFGDVRPATRARRQEPRDDLISHLLEQGWTDSEIVGECLTFAAAGMITTREFVNVAAWHLFTDAGLLEQYRAAPQDDRLAILREILRLEPVVGNLQRRTTAAVEVPDGEGSVTIPAGNLIDIALDVANIDKKTIGPQPLTVWPHRQSVDAGLSFGTGPHRCPGAHIAVLETDVFLWKLFELDGVQMVSPPHVSFDDVLGSYMLRGLTVALCGEPA
ncbi:cytochrome P450 [Nocardia sp. NPDC057030]|uniref:cytochrome P450 n=1 Tax=unclassified Nocardia TaxID=2637762 RepID=UPI00363BEB46